MQEVILTIQRIITLIIPVVISFGMVMFVWGIVQYVIGDDEEAKKNGKDRIIYGILAFTVITGLWGLVKVVIRTFGIYPISVSTATTESCNAVGTFGGIITYLICVINQSIIPLIFSLALLVFVYGVVKFFIIEADEEAQRTQGKDFLIWSIVAFTVMISVWGLVRILGGVIHTNTSIIPQLNEN